MGRGQLDCSFFRTRRQRKSFCSHVRPQLKNFPLSLFTTWPRFAALWNSKDRCCDGGCEAVRLDLVLYKEHKGYCETLCRSVDGRNRCQNSRVPAGRCQHLRGRTRPESESVPDALLEADSAAG